MKIAFVDLRRQHLALKKHLQTAFLSKIESNDLTLGKEADLFEKEFAAYCGKKYAIGVNSGTDALVIALMAYGIGKGDEVITVPNSYVSTAMSITNVGAIPVFVDIDPVTHTIDVAQIEAKINKKTRAILPVHLFGQAADMDKILVLARKYNLFVIEDACQAHGAMYKGKRVPYGETGAFSFYPSKNLGALGDGGAIVTNNKKIAERAKYLRNDGSIKKYYHEIIGIKSRLDTLHAAVLKIKLAYLDGWTKRRREHAKLYAKLLTSLSGITVPTEVDQRYHVYHLYVIETKYRDTLEQFLKQHGIETIVHYPIPIHLQKAYKNAGYKKGDFPITEEKARQMLSLPMFAEIKREEVEFICEKIKEFFINNPV